MLSELVEPEQPNLIPFKKDEIQESYILLLRKYVAYQILYYLHIKQFICKAMCIYHVKYVFYCISELVWASTNLLRQVSEIWGDLDETQAHNIMVCKRILNYLAKLRISAKWLSFHLRTRWLSVQFRFQLPEKILKSF